MRASVRVSVRVGWGWGWGGWGGGGAWALGKDGSGCGGRGGSRGQCRRRHDSGPGSIPGPGPGPIFGPGSGWWLLRCIAPVMAHSCCDEALHWRPFQGGLSGFIGGRSRRVSRAPKGRSRARARAGAPSSLAPGASPAPRRAMGGPSRVGMLQLQIKQTFLSSFYSFSSSVSFITPETGDGRPFEDLARTDAQS